MLHTTRNLIGDAIAAKDGEIGNVEDIYFDDAAWRVRYLVVDIGKWLPGRKVLISPLSVDPKKSSESAISVTLTRDEVEHSPPVECDKPVSRQYEEAHARYYGHSLYWMAPEARAIAVLPDEEDVRKLKEAERKATQSHLRSSEEVIGYSIQAADGPLGHVDDLMVDDSSWSIRDLIVDTRNWLPGKKVRLPPSVVEEIDWEKREVRIRMPRREVEHAAPAA